MCDRLTHWRNKPFMVPIKWHNPSSRRWGCKWRLVRCQACILHRTISIDSWCWTRDASFRTPAEQLRLVLMGPPGAGRQECGWMMHRSPRDWHSQNNQAKEPKLRRSKKNTASAIYPPVTCCGTRCQKGLTWARQQRRSWTRVDWWVTKSWLTWSKISLKTTENVPTGQYFFGSCQSIILMMTLLTTSWEHSYLHS